MVIKQSVPITFGGGINTKVDPKQLQSGQLLTLQNGQFSKTGQINKRFGYTASNTTIEGGGHRCELDGLDGKASDAAERHGGKILKWANDVRGGAARRI